jgi:hypothetical protein
MVYWQALATPPLVELIEGKFKNKRIECRHPKCPGRDRRFSVCPRKSARM